MFTVCQTPNPTLDQIGEAIRSCLGIYVEFRYVTQTKPKKETASVVKQKEDTKFVAAKDDGKFDLYKGFVFDHDPNTNVEILPVWTAGNGHPCFMFWTMTRQAADVNGHWEKYEYVKGQYLPRTLRLVGIRLDTVVVGSKKVRLFPNAESTDPNAQAVADLVIGRAEPVIPQPAR